MNPPRPIYRAGYLVGYTHRHGRLWQWATFNGRRGLATSYAAAKANVLGGPHGPPETTPTRGAPQALRPVRPSTGPEEGPPLPDLQSRMAPDSSPPMEAPCLPLKG